MRDEGDRPPFAIEEDGDVRYIVGRHFAVSFGHVRGRWTHDLLQSRHPWGPREMFARAVEWDAERDDSQRVTSPVFQELQLGIDPSGSGQALLVGMSGRHHFSASFLLEELAEDVVLTVDVADRCREPSYLASTYAVNFGSGGLTDADESAISWDRTYYRLTFAAGPSTRVGMAESGQLAVLVQAGADPDLDGPTRRCRYTWRYTHAASRLGDARLSRRWLKRRYQVRQETPMDHLRLGDPEVYDAIVAEEDRQRDELELIASENYTSLAVMEAVGSVLTNKYAEGLPGKRYYGGCQHVDVTESLAIGRAKALFGAEHVNVQPHSGATANQAVYYAALEIGDPVLAMDLAQGGHLTHGMKLNFSGRWYPTVGYGVDPKTERIDLDQVARLAREHRPKLILAGASAYPRIIDFAAIGEIAREVGAIFFVDMAHIAGLVAGGVHPSPFPHADYVTTTTHKTLRGPRGGIAMCKADRGKKLDSAVFPGLQGGPLEHVIAGKAVCFGEALRPDFKAYAAQVVANAATLADELIRAGFRLTSGGTDNHLVLIDMTSKGLTGKLAEAALGRAGITVNKNLIPFDARKPLDPSGIRMGTAALTTRGLKEDAFRQVAAWIVRACEAPDDLDVAARVAGEIGEFARDYPVPADAVLEPR